MNDRAAFSATYSDWKLVRTRKVVQLVFEVPVEQADLAYAVLGGMPDPGKSVWCAVARLKEGGDQPAERAVVEAGMARRSTTDTTPAPSAAQPGRARTPFDQMSPAQQAGVLCNDTTFAQFLRERRRETYNRTTGPANEFERAAQCVRSLCGVKTRADIAANAASGWHWKSLVDDYRIWQRYPELADA